MMKNIMFILLHWFKAFIYLWIQKLIMIKNGEIHISTVPPARSGHRGRRAAGRLRMGLDPVGGQVQELTEAEKFGAWLKATIPLAPTSVNKYQAIVASLLKSSGGRFDVEKAVEFVRRKNRLGIRAATMKYIDYLEMTGRVSGDTALLWKLKWLPRVKEKMPRPRDVAGSTELMAVVNALEGDAKLIGLFMFYTGCRVHEAVGLRAPDIDFSTGKVTLYGKGRVEKKPRANKIPPVLLDMLRLQVQDRGLLASEYAFMTESRASVESRAKMFGDHLRAASVKVLGRSMGTHDFRRRLASDILETLGNPAVAQEQLGHDNITTTMRYAKYANTEKYLDAVRDMTVARDKKLEGGK
jgi:integrase